MRAERYMTAANVLEKLIGWLEQPVTFTRDSTAFDMGFHQSRRETLAMIKKLRNKPVEHNSQETAVYARNTG